MSGPPDSPWMTPPLVKPGKLWYPGSGSFCKPSRHRNLMTNLKNSNGALVFNKPVGPTSHDMVYRCRRILGKGVKVGHTGTLDPQASGVLVLVVGQATRLARYIQATSKQYVAEILLGRETDTYDREGRIVSEKNVPILGAEEIESHLNAFRGKLDQVPPMFSAVKINGERLYKAARRQETIERPARSIEIYSLTLLAKSDDLLKVEVTCSSGTYIRSLAHDLGQRIGCGGHLASLVRTRSGSFTLENAGDPEEIARDPEKFLVPMIDLLPELPAVELTGEESNLISHGRPVARKIDSESPEFRLVREGELLSIAFYDGILLHPKLVFPANP